MLESTIRKSLPGAELYPISVTDRSASLLPALGSGWYDLEIDHVWSGKGALLELPLPSQCKPRRCLVKIHFIAFGASSNRPVDVYISGNKGNSESINPLHITTALPQEVLVPLDSGETEITQHITIKVPAAISPKELQGSADERTLGIALLGIDLIETKTH
jgi:hypothetical protein